MGFNGLYISTSGLLGSQTGLQVTSNNIANANTEGYSRRMTHFREGVTTTTRMSTSRLLTGTQVSDINRVRNMYLDHQVRQQKSNFHRDEQIAEISFALNDILGEPSDSGLAAKLNQFFQAASDFAANPEVATAKAVFINSADSLTKAFNQIDQSFEIFKGNISDSPSGLLPSKVEDLNNKLQELYEVNRQATVANNIGNRAEDLNDQRDLLVDQISELMEVDINRLGNGELDSLSIDIHASEARTTGTVNFLNTSTPIAGLTAGNNSFDLSVNNGNGTVVGPFTVNFTANSTPSEVVEKINKTYNAAGGEGTIASLDEAGQLNITTSLMANAVNNTTAEVNIIGGSGTTLATLGLAVGVTNGTDATTETLLDSRGLYYIVDVDAGEFADGVNPNRIIYKNNDILQATVGQRDGEFGGEIGGIMHMANEVIPELQEELSYFAMSIKDSVNKILQLGTTENGNQGSSIFTGTSAGDFAVDDNVKSNPGLIAQGKTGAVSDGSIMAEIADLFFGDNNIVSDLSAQEKLYIDSPGTGPVNPVTSQIAIVPGEPLTLHVDGIIDDGGSPVNGGQNGFGTGSLVQYQFLDETGAVISGPTDFPASAGAPESRVSDSLTVPAGAAFVQMVWNGAFNDADLTDNTGHFSVQVLQGADPSITTSLNNKMADIVGEFGTQGNLAQSNAENSNSLLRTLDDRRQSIMGVSIEEEAGSLIQFQNAFAANARVVSVWDEIYQTIINL